MFHMHDYDQARLQMEQVRHRAEHLSRHLPPKSRGWQRTRTRRRDKGQRR